MPIRICLENQNNSSTKQWQYCSQLQNLERHRVHFHFWDDWYYWQRQISMQLLQHNAQSLTIPHQPSKTTLLCKRKSDDKCLSKQCARWYKAFCSLHFSLITLAVVSLCYFPLRLSYHHRPDEDWTMAISRQEHYLALGYCSDGLCSCVHCLTRCFCSYNVYLFLAEVTS